MRQAEVLLAAIKKAEANGFVMDKHKHFCEVGRNLSGKIESLGAYQSIIYDPDFGIALWGEKPTCKWCGSREFDSGKSFNGEVTEYQPNCKVCGLEALDELEFSEGTTLPAYLYHQQKMLTYAAPIMYLESFIK